MSLSVRPSPQDEKTINIFSGSILIGAVKRVAAFEQKHALFQWSTRFAEYRLEGDSASLQDAALAIALRWRDWLRDAALEEKGEPIDAVENEQQAMKAPDAARLAFIAVHRALVAQRAEINQLRGLIQAKGKSIAHRRSSRAGRAPSQQHKAASA